MKSIPIRKALVVFKEEVKPHIFFAHGFNPPLKTHRKKTKLTDHEKTLVSVIQELKRRKISHQIVSRNTLKRVDGFDLLITVGGDGTFLDASHYAKPRQILFGVNSHPKLSHGAFCLADGKNFGKILASFLKKSKPLLPLYRLEARLNGKKIRILALNDVLFANRSPAGTSRYLLAVGNRKEEQKSSGIWISSAAGSTAAIRSAGGRLLPKGSKKIQFVVREPFHDGRRKYRLTKGILSPPKKITILSKMSLGMIFLDGPHLAFPVKRGDRVEVKISPSSLRAVLKT